MSNTATGSPELTTPDGPAAGYRTLPDIPDELMDRSGNIRPVWSRLTGHLAGIEPQDFAPRFARGDQYLRDAGVYYRQYGENIVTERAWPLSHIPVLIADDEWQHLSRGLIQRADLLEEIAADLYGDNRLVAEGHLPAALIATSPEWLRPLVGVKPRTGYFLHFLAFEVGRGPDGSWWVLGDRTQAPSGAAFALENRVATRRVFPELYRQANVRRLAQFFRAFLDSLQGLRAENDSRVGILTAGPLNETYYEQAYIARYLGLMLLEGEDLTVVNGELMVRTVAGLRPVSVLWRRLDASWADPLELDEHSQLGTPGLVSAIRRGSVTMINALGAGVLETRAFLAFLPRICEALRSEKLIIPNIATWWCGQPAELDHVRRNAETMMIGPALSTRLPLEVDDETALAGRLRGGRSIEEMLDNDAPLLVAQESVTLSTTPAWSDGKLVPRPMSVRMFLARTPSGWAVMPGGFARIGTSNDPTAIGMRTGGTVADVWVIANTPVAEDTMLPQANDTPLRNQASILPSRAADNLFWLGRYVERTEGLMRLVRAYHARYEESGGAAPLLSAIGTHLLAYGVNVTKTVPAGLLDTLGAAVASARKIQDRLSVDGWTALTDLDKAARQMVGIHPGDNVAEAISSLLRKVTAFAGLVHDNMYRFVGWRFLSIGRSLERAAMMTSMLATFADPAAPEGGLDLAIEVGDSVMTHRRRYSVTTTRGTVIDLLALDAANPRSVLFQLTEIREHAAYLPNAEVNGSLSDLSREILKIHTALSVERPRTLDTRTLNALRAEILAISDRLSAQYFG